MATHDNAEPLDGWQVEPRKCPFGSAEGCACESAQQAVWVHGETYRLGPNVELGEN
jgi:hypothetical protein